MASRSTLAVDDEHGELLIRRGKTVDAPPPRALLKGGPLDGRAMREALGRLADSVIAGGIDGDGPYRAVRDLLLGRSPRIAGRADGGALVEPGETVLQAARRIAVGLPEAETVLAIQGPPGTGKTYTGGRMIVELSGQVGGSASRPRRTRPSRTCSARRSRRRARPGSRSAPCNGSTEARRPTSWPRWPRRRTPRSPRPLPMGRSTSSPGPAGCSPVRSSSGASTSCSSTKRGSSRSPTPWRPARRPGRSSSSAIPTSCPR